MKKAIFDTIVQLNSRPAVANALKRFAMSRFSKPLIRPFIRTYQIQTDQALKPVDSFNSLHDCFVRELRPEMRPIASASDAFVSPSDAVLSIVPALTEDSRFTIKGQDYTVAELIGSTERAQDYANGVALIFYLSPTDYHRVHSPITGEITNSYTLGRESAPVNDMGLRFSKRPLTRNYRRVTRLQVDHRSIEHVMVGALNVNTIVQTHKGRLLERGEEFGYFSFGSTVILVLPPNTVELSPGIERSVQMGEQIGRWLP